MKVSDAATTYKRLAPNFEAMKADRKLLEEAEEALKGYAREHPDRRSYSGIAFDRSTRNRLDMTAAKALLSADEIEQCTVPSEAIRLVLS